MNNENLDCIAADILMKMGEGLVYHEFYVAGREKEIAHAQDVLRWVRLLCKDPSPELEAAALLHDSERLINIETAYGFTGERNSLAYLEHKKTHARRSADLARQNLFALGIPAISTDRVYKLILHHDDTGKEIELINDPELMILVAADSFSLFTSLNAFNLLEREGRSRLEDKVRFMIGKMSIQYRQLLVSQKIDNSVIDDVKTKILKEFGVI